MTCECCKQILLYDTFKFALIHDVRVNIDLEQIQSKTKLILHINKKRKKATPTSMFKKETLMIKT